MATRALIRRWVAALRSGDYKQGTHYLIQKNEIGELEYCCLGVLGEVAEDSLDDLRDEGEILKVPWFEHHIGLSQTTLTGMNDTDGKTFTEIADYIEKELLD